MKRKAQIWIFHRPSPSAEIRVLLFRLNEQRGGFWQPVTGGIEEGESVLEGAARELVEETGFVPGPLLDLQHSFRFLGRWGEAEESAFAFQLDREASPRLDPKEHQAFEWVSLPEAQARIPFPEQKKGLEKLVKLLRDQKLS